MTGSNVPTDAGSASVAAAGGGDVRPAGRFAAWLTARMRDAGLSSADLAAVAGCAAWRVDRWLTVDDDAPATPPHLVAGVAAAIGVTPGELLARGDRGERLRAARAAGAMVRWARDAAPNLEGGW